MEYTIETEQDDDGRWVALLLDIPGLVDYGETKEDAITKVIKKAGWVTLRKFVAPATGSAIEAVAAWAKALPPSERLGLSEALQDHFCLHCGEDQPASGRGCPCMNDE